MTEAEADEAIYRIQFGNFSSRQCYLSLCVDLEFNFVAHVPGVKISKDDSFPFIVLSFLTKDAIDAFEDFLPLGFENENDKFEFVERKRNRKTKKWVLVTKPIMWKKRN